MCRFVTYFGPQILISDLLYEPENSLIRQSLHARERTEPLNGDGFGVGWYVPQIDETPCVFKSVTPAWRDRNLASLARKTRASILFAHVRAATGHSPVSWENCHPFSWGPYLFFHNGGVEGVEKIRRPLLEAVPDDIYNQIQGSTDSELLFSLFLKHLREQSGSNEGNRMAEALLATLLEVVGIARGSCELNCAVTDGRHAVFTKFSSGQNVDPPSLHYAFGEGLELRDDQLRMRPPSESGRRCFMVVSERLSGDKQSWKHIPANSMLVLHEDLEFSIRPILLP